MATDKFLGPNWLLDTKEAVRLFHDKAVPSAGASLLTSSGGPVCDGRKILSEESRFEVFDRVICRAVGRLVADGQVSKNGGFGLMKALMHENQAKLFRLA